MKKKFFAWVLVAMAGLMVSCSEDAPNNQPPQQDSEEVVYYTPKRTMAQAIEIAQMAVQDEQAISRSERTVTGLSSVRPLTRVISRGLSDTLMYVVQYDDNRGYALVSAPECVEPLIALIDNGTFDSFETQTNEPFQETVNCAKDYIARAVGFEPITPVGPEPFKPVKLIKFDTIKPTPKTVPSVKVEWNQYWPENIFAPNSVAGCVPVAIAQILSVFETPANMQYTFDGRDISSETIDWPSLKKHTRSTLDIDAGQELINDHLLHCQANDKNHKTLGRLVRQIGALCSSRYDDYMLDGKRVRVTSTSTGNEEPVLKNLLPGKTITKGSSGSKLFEVLVGRDKAVAFVGGLNTATSGHGWIADGTWSIGTLVKEYHYDYTLKAYVLTYTYGENNRYIHYNWGWGGDSNGYFLESIYNPINGYEYDHYNGNHNYDFRTQFYYLNIKS